MQTNLMAFRTTSGKGTMNPGMQVALLCSIMSMHRRLMEHMSPQAQFWIRQQANQIRRHGFGPLQQAVFRVGIINMIPRPASPKTRQTFVYLLAAMVVAQVLTDGNLIGGAAGGMAVTASVVASEILGAASAILGGTLATGSAVAAGTVAPALGLVAVVLATGLSLVAAAAGAGAAFAGGVLGLGAAVGGGVLGAGAAVGGGVLGAGAAVGGAGAGFLGGIFGTAAGVAGGIAAAASDPVTVVTVLSIIFTL